MAGITWLHLSDWHQGGKDFNRDVVRDGLVNDIRKRKIISADLAKIDFFVFSGDVAFSGQEAEYKAAIEQLFTPVLEAAGLAKDKLFIVPGNHDFDREKFTLLNNEVMRPLDSKEKVIAWLTYDDNRNHLLQPFAKYKQFVMDFTGQNQPDYASIHRFVVDGKYVALLGLNSALMCGRKKDMVRGRRVVNDYGWLVVGEPQLYSRLPEIENASICIAVLHHPFSWLTEFDNEDVEHWLRKHCHFILCGHRHRPSVKVEGGIAGDTVIIPAGASYYKRIAQDPRFTNAYNFVHLDFTTTRVEVYLRRWSEQQKKFMDDTDSYEDGRFQFDFPKSLRDSLSLPSAAPAINNHTEDEDTKKSHKHNHALITKPSVSQPPPTPPIRPLQRNKAPINDRDKLLALLSNCSTKTFSRTALLIDAPGLLFSDRDTQAERASKLIDWAEHSGGRGLSALYMAYLREALEKTRDEHFGKGDLIYKDQCDPAIETLKNLSKLVQKLLENDKAYGYQLTVPLNYVANQISDLKTLLDIFHNQCPPPRQNALEKDYPKNRDAINNQMKSLVTALDSLLSKLKQVTNI
jgi:predicted phosphodiesterase